MKHIAFIVLAFLAFEAQAATLTCWNIFARRGSAPILRTDIENDTTLVRTNFNLQDKYFADYFIDVTGDAGPVWGNKPTHTKSSLTNPRAELSPSIITSNRSPYKGRHEYNFVFGTYSFTSPYHNTQGEYPARLVLPQSLSKETMAQTRIRDNNERSNAVLILPAAYGVGQGGDNYLRLFCESDL